MNFGIADLEHGGFKVMLMRNGNHLVQVRFYGLTENVSYLAPVFFPETDLSCFRSGCGKECHLV